MVDDTKVSAKKDIFALTVENGSPAYPQMIYAKDGDKTYGDGSPVMKELGVVKNPEEHKALLDSQKAGWGK